MTTLKAVHSGMMMRGLSIRRMSLQTANRTRLLSAMPQLQDSEEPHQPPFLDENNAASLSAFRSYALHSPQFKYPHKTTSTVTTNPSTSFAGFVDSIPQTVRRRQETLRKNPAAFDDGRDDPVMALFRNMSLTKDDWMRYAHFDPTRPYTRNLISTDHETFTLLLLCWNPACESKIHDHPCDGCWMQVLQGQVNECRYEYPAATTTSSSSLGAVAGADHLQCIADETFVEGQVAYINDSIGLHKVGNPSMDVPAITLHLYSPPFQDCRVWVENNNDDNNVGSNNKNANSDNTCMSVSTSYCATHFSEYGRVV